MENELLKLLKPQNIFKTKKRLGAPHEDGGYIMADYVLENCVALFSYGIGNDSRYEEDFSSKYNKPSYMFDHTPSAAGFALQVPDDELPRYTAELSRLKDLGCHFFSEGLGYEENCKDFNEHYEELNINGPVLLKMDIEGGEYQYFLKTDIVKLESRVMGIIVEVHWINIEKNQNDLVEILKKLNEFFILFHVHGNTWGDIWAYGEHMIPQTMELSFINRKYVEKYEPDKQKYPIPGLDVSNRPGFPDYELTFLDDPISEEPIDFESSLQIPIGDVVDRYTICKLKAEKGKIDVSKETNELLNEIKKYDELEPYIELLFDLNGKIWDLESDIKPQSIQTLGAEEVGRRALQIRDLNNKRNEIKKEINLKYNEGFIDEKLTPEIEVVVENNQIENDYEPSVIVSLTTVPERLSDMSDTGIILTIKSLCEQQDNDYEIHFNIPEIYNITKEPYVIPDWIFEYQKEHPRLKIFKTEDYGPPTKIIPTLQRIKNPETIIVVVDDDLVYHPDMISEHRKYQNILLDSAICYDGREPKIQVKYGDLRDSWISCVTEIREIEMVQHYKSISYKKKLFNQDFYDYYVGKTLSDDILISTFLKNNNIRMFVVPYEKETYLFLTKELWEQNLGVTTFPVLRHTSSVANTGCSHPGLLALPEGARFYMPDNLGKKE